MFQVSFYQKENVRAFITILGVTMKSETEQNAFVEKLAGFFFVINLPH